MPDTTDGGEMPSASLHHDFEAEEKRLGGGVLGVAAKFLTTGETVRFRADEVFPTASTIKIAIVAELYAQKAEGRIPAHRFMDACIPIPDTVKVGGSGILAHLTTPDLRYSLDDLALLTIKLSDNTASNLCLHAVGGPESVNRRLHEEWGMARTTIHRPIKFSLGVDDPPHTATGTPQCFTNVLEQLVEGRVHSSAVSERVISLMGEVSDAEMLPRFLDVNYYARDLRNAAPPFRVAHKPGAVTGVRNDVGIVQRGEETLIVAIFTKNCPDTVWTPENHGTHVVARVAKRLCDRYFG